MGQVAQGHTTRKERSQSLNEGDQGYTVQSGAKLSNAQRGVLLLIPILQLSKLRLRGIKRLTLT